MNERRRILSVELPLISELRGRRAHRPLLAWILLALSMAGAVLTPRSLLAQAQTLPAATEQNPTNNSQAISQTGLLPVYGVDVRVDPSWISATHANGLPANAASSVNSEFEQLWSSLKPGGYNVLRVPIDVRRPAEAANRAASLCLWAKTNGVRLILLLAGADDGRPIEPSYPEKTSAFVLALINALRANNSQDLSSYGQIMAYQVEDEINHVGRHAMETGVAQQLVLKAAQELRKKEAQALEGSGLQATPLLVSVSLDFELIKARAIAGAVLTDEAYERASNALTEFLAPITASQDIDLIAVDWFPGSLSAGGVEKFPALLRAVVARQAGKQWIITTGFSTAFHDQEDQKHFYALAFTTLGDYRASVGVNCPFVGVLFHEALNRNEKDKDPARPGLPAEMSKWDWPTKADELMRMWVEKKKSADMAWWLKKTMNTMGLTILQANAGGTPSMTPAPAQEAMTQIATTVSDANSTMAATAKNADPSANTFGQTSAAAGQSSAGATGLGGKVQQGLLGLVDAVFQRMGNVVSTRRGANLGCTSSVSSNTTWNSGTTGSYDTTVSFGTPGTFGTQPNYGVSSSSATCGAMQGYGGYTNASDPNQGWNGGSYGTPGWQGSQISQDSFGSQGSPGSYGSPNTGGVPIRPGYGNNNSSPSSAGTSPATNGTVLPPNSLTLNSTPALQLTAQDVSFQPSNPQAQDSIVFTVKLNNLSQNYVPGVSIYAIADDNTQLAQSETFNLAPSVHSTTPLSKWIPTQAKTYRITITVADGYGNQQATLPVSVTVAERTQSANNGSSAANTSAPCQPPDRAPPLHSSDTPQSFAGPAQSSAPCLSASGQSSSSSPDGTQSAGASQSSGQSQDSGTSSSNQTSGQASSQSPAALPPPSQTPDPVLKTPVGGVKYVGSQVGGVGQELVPGQSTPVSVSLYNPYLVQLNNVQATLMLDGKPVQTQSLATLLPGQNRSLLFPSMKVPPPGRHEMRIVLQSQRPGAKPQAGLVTNQITVANVAKHSVRPIVVGLPPVQPATNVRSVLPPVFRVGAVSVPTAPSTSTGHSVPTGPTVSLAAPRVSGLGRTTPGSPHGTNPQSSPNAVVVLPPAASKPGSSGASATAKPGSAATTAGNGSGPAQVTHPIVLPQAAPDLSVTTRDIRYSPALPAAGQVVSFSVTVRNLGKGVAQRASLVFRLMADGRQVAWWQPQPFDLAPGATRDANWQSAMPAVRQVQLIVNASASQDSNTANNQAAVTIPVAPPRIIIPPKRH